VVGRVVCRGTVKKPPQNAPKQTHSTKVKPSCELREAAGLLLVSFSETALAEAHSARHLQ